MAHRIDAEQDQDAGHGAVVALRPRSVTSAPRAFPAGHPVPLRPAQRQPRVARKPIWDKDNVGFWLVACILLSVAFAVVYRAIG